MITFNKLQQVGSVNFKGETRSVQGSSLVALQKELDVAVQTCCFLLLRYDVNQSMAFPPRLYDFLNRAVFCQQQLSYTKRSGKTTQCVRRQKPMKLNKTD